MNMLFMMEFTNSRSKPCEFPDFGLWPISITADCRVATFRNQCWTTLPLQAVCLQHSSPCPNNHPPFTISVCPEESVAVMVVVCVKRPTNDNDPSLAHFQIKAACESYLQSIVHNMSRNRHVTNLVHVWSLFVFSLEQQELHHTSSSIECTAIQFVTWFYSCLWNI